MKRRRSQGAGPFFDNLRQPMAFGEKMRLAARNTWLKIKRRDSCCGHPGEPGC